ncbi:hypothetical protein CRUP_000385 [Coryphaenoides rupestris]|nr:hypothetical protein CRUP_000385 [Coryphaenoides rupestris]
MPMDLSTVNSRLTAYRGPAEVVADVRLLFRTREAYYEANSEVAMANWKLERFFEEQLTLVYPDLLFPEIKREPEHLSCLGPSPRPTERRLTDYDAQHALGSPNGQHGTG